MIRNVLLLLVFLIISVNSISAEPCFGYTVNRDTNECVFGLLYDDFDTPPTYSNCYIIDGCTGGKVEWDPSKMNCTYMGCDNNCRRNETRASVASIGCTGKNNDNDNKISTSLIIGIVILSFVVAYFVFKKIMNYKKY